MAFEPIYVEMTVAESEQRHDMTLSTEIRPVIDVPEYDGEYTVTPTEEAQTLETNGKRMTDDVTIEAIQPNYVGSSIPRKSAQTFTPTTVDQTISAEQYLDGDQIIKGDSALLSSNIKKDVEIFGVLGSFEGGIAPSGTLDITENGTYDVAQKASVNVSVKQWDDELTAVLDGTATELRDLPSGVTNIKPYAFYKTGGRQLPSGYDELDYIQSTGTQHIISNIAFNPNTPYKITIDMQGTASNNSNGVGWNAGGGVYMRNNFYGNGTTSGTTTINGSQRVIVAIDITSGTSNYTFTDIYGTVLSSLSRGNTSLIDWAGINYPLFATTDSTGSPPRLAKWTGRIYRFTASVNGVLASDFLPASHNGEVGFYDLIGGSFYGNDGTGSFIGGSVIPRSETESIQSADLSVTEIGYYAFYNNELSSLTLRANQVVTLGEHALDGTPIANGTGNIYVPSDLVESYKADTQWSAWANKISAI